MKHLSIWVLVALVSTGSGGCTGMEIPDTRIGLNVPPPGSERTFRWDRVPSASAYQVVVTTDRAGTQPVGVTSFTGDTQMTLAAVAWQQGHPILGRPYFWTLRAYDRPDPQGVLLTVRGPQEILFEATDFRGTGWLVSPSPSAVPASTAPPSAAPVPTFSTAP